MAGFGAALSASRSSPSSPRPLSSPGRFTPDCSNRTSWLAWMWICLCSRGVRTLAPPRGKDFSSSLKTLGLGAELAGVGLAGEGSAGPSDLRGRLADRSVDGPFSFLASAFRFTAAIASVLGCWGVGELQQPPYNLRRAAKTKVGEKKSGAGGGGAADSACALAGQRDHDTASTRPTSCRLAWSRLAPSHPIACHVVLCHDVLW